MAALRKKVGKIVALAEQIEADIRTRELTPGDRYLSTVDTARMLRVDTTDVNKALQLLVKRGVLIRRQRVGAVIADSFNNPDERRFGAIHFLMSDRAIRSEGLFDSDMVMGLQSAVPGTKLLFDAVSRNDEEDAIQEIISAALRLPKPEGFVLVNSTLTMQRAFAASELPSVVLGHLYPSVDGIPFVDRDQRKVGALLAGHLIDRGHRNVIYLARQRFLPGDHVAFDAVCEALAEAGLPLSALTLRCLPHDREVIAEELTGVLGRFDTPPAILARTAVLAEAAIDAVASAGLTPHQDVTIVAADFFRSPKESPAFPVIRPTLGLQEQGAVIGQLLRRQLNHGKKEEQTAPRCVLADVELVVPDQEAVHIEQDGENET